MPAQYTKAGTRRLAVLPFEDLTTGDAAFHGRSLGMALTARLTKLDGVSPLLTAISKRSRPRETAAELRLSHAIQGSIPISQSIRCSTSSLKSWGARRALTPAESCARSPL